MTRRIPALLSALVVSSLPFIWQATAQDQVTSPELQAETDAAPTFMRPVGEDRAETLEAIATALESVQTASGRFGQINPDSTYIEGEFALQRPGRVRFDYDDPSPILIVADGTTVAIEDSDLETFERVPLGRTPLKLMFDKNVDFESDAEIVDLVTAPEEVFLTVRDRNGDIEGELTMILDPSSYQLQGWRVLDSTGSLTAVQLMDVETNKRLSQRLFRIEDPEDAEDE
ncbi:MAG: outer membrane lipoprotein carrier protein LolA [Pseudomonadota bacterium]